MSSKVYTQAFISPDVGFLKGSDHEWDNLQNFRGWGNRITRRLGVRNSIISTSGIMGIHDLSVDGDPTSPEKILATLYDGTILVLNYSEIYTAFTFLFTGTAKLYLQSPDLNWWDCTPDSNGLLSPTVVATPGTTISTDLSIGQNQLFGFSDTTGVTQLYVANGSPQTQRYNLTGSETSYTITQAWVTGVGPVFQDSLLTRFRLTIDNAGELTTTTI